MKKLLLIIPLWTIAIMSCLLVYKLYIANEKYPIKVFEYGLRKDNDDIKYQLEKLPKEISFEIENVILKYLDK